MAASTSSMSAPRPPAVVPRTGPWVAGGAGALALVLVAGWFLVISPQRSAMDDTEASIAQAQDSVTMLSGRVAQLKQQYASLPELQAELASLEAQLPADPALPALVRSLRAAAQSTGAELTGLTPSAPKAFSAGTSPAPATTAGTASADASTTASTTTTVASGAAAEGGLLEVPVTITATGSYAALEGFLAAVQRQQRLLLITGTGFAPGGGATGSDLTLTITGEVFVMAAAGSTAGTVPTSAPTIAPTSAPTSVPTSAPTSTSTAPAAAPVPTATTTTAG